VLISLAGIGLVMWLVTRGLGSISLFRGRGHEMRDLDSLEHEVEELRTEVDELKRRIG